MTCKGICDRYVAKKPVGAGRYASGQKRCSMCELFIKWDDINCPCCGIKLRNKPRNLKYKVKYRVSMEKIKVESSVTQQVERKSDNSWYVKSKSRGVPYTVTQTQKNFKCTCNKQSCTHIHAVRSLLITA